MKHSVRVRVSQDDDGCGVVYVNDTPAYMFSGSGRNLSVEHLEPDAGKENNIYSSVVNAVKYHNSVRETEMCMGRKPPSETEITFSAGADREEEPDFRPIF